MSSNEPIKLDKGLALAVQPVDIPDLNGKLVRYEIRELDGFDRNEYQGIVESRVEHNDKGINLGVVKEKGLILKLLSLTLHDDKGVRVPEAVFGRWPAVLLKRLFKMSADLSCLTKETQEAEGNA